MRRLSVLTAAVLVSLVSLTAHAQVSKPPARANVPPPPTIEQFDPALEPQVTIRQTERGTESEYRVRGKLYMVRVTPAAGGPAYFLVDQKGDGNFIRSDNVGPSVQPPMWVIGTF